MKREGRQSVRSSLPEPSSLESRPALAVRTGQGIAFRIRRRRLQAVAAWIDLETILCMFSTRVNLSTILPPYPSQEMPESDDGIQGAGRQDRTPLGMGFPKRIRQDGGGREDRDQQQGRGHSR